MRLATGPHAPPTIGEAIGAAGRRLAAAGVDAPRRDARLLLAHALGTAPEVVFAYPERRLSAQEGAAFGSLLGRRAGRQPMAQILGRREFWSLDFAVTPAVLTPRPESETVVEAVLDAGPDPCARVLDLGTGSGCLLLALLAELPNAHGIGVDLSAAAIAVAAANARALGLAGRARFCVGDWGRALGERFDVIVSNPPYVTSAAIDSLAPESCRHEPRMALDGGSHGLDAMRALAPEVARLLAPGGVVAIEIGAGQGIEVENMFATCGLTVTARRRDLAGVERCLLLAGR